MRCSGGRGRDESTGFCKDLRCVHVQRSHMSAAVEVHHLSEVAAEAFPEQRQGRRRYHGIGAGLEDLDRRRDLGQAAGRCTKELLQLVHRRQGST